MLPNMPYCTTRPNMPYCTTRVSEKPKLFSHAATNGFELQKRPSYIRSDWLPLDIFKLNQSRKYISRNQSSSAMHIRQSLKSQVTRLWSISCRDSKTGTLLGMTIKLVSFCWNWRGLHWGNQEKITGPISFGRHKSPWVCYCLSTVIFSWSVHVQSELHIAFETCS